jgi:DNA processing protein
VPDIDLQKSDLQKSDLDNELRNLLLLFRILVDKPMQLASVLKTVGSATDIIENSPKCRSSNLPGKITALIRNKLNSALLKRVEMDMNWLAVKGHHLMVLGHPAYPPLLAQIADPPVLLFCRGNLESFELFKIAMVGSRNPTRMGIKYAEQFAQQLASLGIAVTSGLALGIDGASHRGALSVDGITIAVLGSGCDVIYPARHSKLALQIEERGLIISEFPLGTPAYPVNFPRRNRIVTGMSLGTLVVEAQERSGSLISARLAMEQGREVFALPGSIQSRQSRGCHRLIRDGAKLVDNLEQILEELDSLAQFQSQQQHKFGKTKASLNLSPPKAEIVALLGAEPVVLDQLCSLLEQEVSELLAALVELEIDGIIVNEAGGYCLI